MVKAMYQKESRVKVVCIQIGLSSLCVVHLWLNLESVHPYFAAIMSLSVCFRSEVRAIQCVAVYQGVSSAFASRKREY